MNQLEPDKIKLRTRALDVEGAQELYTRLNEEADRRAEGQEPDVFHLDFGGIAMIDSQGIHGLQKFIDGLLRKDRMPTIHLHGLAGRIRVHAEMYLAVLGYPNLHLMN